MKRYRTFLTRTGMMAVVALCAISCRRSEHEAVYPVTGKVLYNGKPAEGATVMFIRSGDGPKTRRSGGQVRADGSFRLSTFTSYDGAPAGSYAVTIIYPSPQKKENDENVGPDLLQGRYTDPKTTPLSAEVKQETNDLEPFQVE